MMNKIFGKHLIELSVADLKLLTAREEGWYVEYKAKMPSSKALAKSVGAFANHEGGCLIIGVRGNDEAMAGEFPGIEIDSEDSFRTTLDNIINDNLSPSPLYEVRIFEGPETSIKLERGRSIVVIEVSPGFDPPYIHSTGVIYVREGGRSSPTKLNDQSSVRALTEKYRFQKERLKTEIATLPELFSGVTVPTIQMMLYTDPYRLYGQKLTVPYEEIVKIMKGEHKGSVPLVCQNVFPYANGILGLAYNSSQPGSLGPTWYLRRDLSSQFVMPLSSCRGNHPRLQEWLFTDVYKSSGEFWKLLSSFEKAGNHIIDVSMLIHFIMASMFSFNAILAEEKYRGSIFLKLSFHNMTACVPFVDLEPFIAQIKKTGIPRVPMASFVAPGDTLPDPFLEIQNDNFSDGRSDNHLKPHKLDSSLHVLEIALTCLGIHMSPEVLKPFPDSIRRASQVVASREKLGITSLF